MNNVISIRAVTIVFCVACIATAAQRNRTVPHPSKLAYDSLNWQVPLGEPYRHVLGDSMVVYAAPDRALPRVVILGHLRYGSICEPAGKEGLSAMMCALMRSGGVVGIPADTLDMILDLFAISVRFTPSDTRIEFGASFLSEYRDTAVALIARMLFTPAFEPGRLEKERAAQLEDVLHRFDNPGPIVSAAHTKAMYPGSAAGRLTTRSSLESITRTDLESLHAAVVRRQNLILGVSGDFHRDSMLALIDRLCPSVGSSLEPVAFPPIAAGSTSRLLLVPKQISQAYVRMSLPLFARPHPDYYAMSVLNHILGGGSFSSRLNTTVRSDAGLTYSIYSSAGSNYVYPATFYVQFFTKTESTLEAIRLVVKEIERIRTDTVRTEELESAKKVFIDGLPSMFRSKEDVIEHYTWNEYYGREPDHFRTYPDKVRAITAQDVLRVAGTYLKVDSLTYVVVADTAALARVDTSTVFSLRSLAPSRVVAPDSIAQLP